MWSFGVPNVPCGVERYVGRVYSVVLSKNKKGECYYRVRGTEGTAVINANDGKLLRFYRKRD
jgi:hypothetical protein